MFLKIESNDRFICKLRPKHPALSCP